MRASELREKSVDELQQDLIELRRQQLNQRIQQSTGQLAQTHEIRQMRRDLARIKTVLKQKAGE